MWQMLCHMICCSVLNWLMLLPSGWWNCHYMMVHGWCYCQVADGFATACRYMADVIARWLLQLPLQVGGWQMLWSAGRCYLPGQFFNFSSEMLNRTSSQMCGRWHLPIFLFRDGSLTLIYRASLMVLMRFWSSLPTISKFSMLMLWPVVLWWSNMGDRAFWCSLNLSPNVLEDSPIYSPSHSTLSHFYL